MEFESLLLENKYAVERFVHFRIEDFEDAEDIIQEIYLAAFQKFSSLNNLDRFKSWIISIAKNKCNDYYRRKMKAVETVDYDLTLIPCEQNQFGRCETSDIAETILRLSKSFQQILNLYFFEDCSQEEIADKLSIPLGTVKSRLYYAKQKFKEEYPYPPKSEGVNMSKLPTILPEYKITKSDKSPFETEWQELMGWLIVPKLNEKITWALYDFPERKQTQYVEMEVTEEAEVHGIRGVKIVAKEYNPTESERLDNDLLSERKFIAQLTDNHCRFLAESHKVNGITKYHTFLDDDEFTRNWGFGENNCGKETHLKQKNIVTRIGGKVKTSSEKSCMDVVGRYIVNIGNKAFDTICVMDIESYDEGIVTEQYIDKNGKTILWRRFNADDWHYEKYQQKWSKKLPDNEQITVNGKTYVHWYDCISDYII